VRPVVMDIRGADRDHLGHPGRTRVAGVPGFVSRRDHVGDASGDRVADGLLGGEAKSAEADVGHARLTWYMLSGHPVDARGEAAPAGATARAGNHLDRDQLHILGHPVRSAAEDTGDERSVPVTTVGVDAVPGIVDAPDGAPTEPG